MATSTTTTKKTTTNKTTSTVNKTIIDQLQAENKELKEKMEELLQLVQSQSNNDIRTQENKFNPEDEITVISLVPHKLNLCTERYGQGDLYEFNSMYEEQDIPWGDLKDIVRANRKMAQNGKFYILNESAVNLLRLRTSYKNMLNPDQFKTILNTQPDKIVEIYKLAPSGQRNIIVEILKNKQLNHENIDLNILHAISDLSGVDLINIENPADIPPEGIK